MDTFITIILFLIIITVIFSLSISSFSFIEGMTSTTDSTTNTQPPPPPPSSSSSNDTTTSTDTLPPPQQTSTTSTKNNSQDTYENYNHYTGNSYPTTLYGSDGSIAKFILSSTTSTFQPKRLEITNSPSTNNNSIYYQSTNLPASVSSLMTTNSITNPNSANSYVGGQNYENLAVLSDTNGTIQMTLTNSITGSTLATYSPTSSNTTSGSTGTTGTTGTSGTTTQPTNLINETFYSSNGNTAQIINYNGKTAVKITYSNGNTSIFYANTNTENFGSSVKYTDAYGNTATFIYVNGQPTIEVVNIDGTQTTYVIKTNSITSSVSSSSAYPSGTYTAYSVSGPQGGQVSQVQGPYGNSATYISGPNNNSVVATSTGIPPQQQQPMATNYDSSAYYNSNTTMYDPNTDNNNMFILKSQVIPPVCPPPLPPIIKTCKSEGKCGPCPPCDRCPNQGDFVCKKEPNYNHYNSQQQQEQLPQPVLSDFSSFGL